MIFGHAVIVWIFFLIFYYCKILNFGLLKVRFRRKKQKDVKDDGISGLIFGFSFIYYGSATFNGFHCYNNAPQAKILDEIHHSTMKLRIFMGPRDLVLNNSSPTAHLQQFFPDQSQGKCKFIYP